MKKLIIILSIILIMLTACSTARQKLSPQGNVNLKTADVYYSQQDVEQAEIYYLKVLEDNPDYVIALRRLGDISLFKAENFTAKEVEYYEDAYEYYTKAISITEQFPDLTDQDRIDLRDMRKRKERAWTRIFLAANKEKEAGNTQRAMEIYELAHKLEPERPEPMIQLKNIYLVDLKDDIKAEQILHQLLQKDPDKLEYLMEMGTFYYNKGNYAEAVKYFEKAKPQIPTNIDNLMNISACYYELKDYEKAMAITKTALEIEPNNVDLLNNARSIAAQINDIDQAIFYLKKLLEIRPNEDDFGLLATYLYNKQDWQELIKYAEQWYNWDKSNKIAIEYIIWAAQQTGNKQLESKYTAIKKTMP